MLPWLCCIRGSVTTKGQADIPGPGCLLGAYYCPWALQNCPHTLPGHRRRDGPERMKARKLSSFLTSCSTWETGPAHCSLEFMTVGELAIPLISHVMALIRERYPAPPFPLPPVKGRRPDPGIMIEELAQPLTSCPTQESSPCTFVGQHSTADPDGRSCRQAGPKGVSM